MRRILLYQGLWKLKFAFMWCYIYIYIDYIYNLLWICQCSTHTSRNVYNAVITNRQVSSRFEDFVERQYSKFRFENFVERKYNGVGFESFEECEYIEITFFITWLIAREEFTVSKTSYYFVVVNMCLICYNYMHVE
jgi:hypothetical protein